MVAQDTISLSPAKAALYATAILGGGVVIGYLVSKKLTKGNRCNHKVKLDCDKIVDTVDIEDGGQKQAFCRCWHSKQFPHCDGSHVQHNKETGDNVGPLIVKPFEKPSVS